MLDGYSNYFYDKLIQAFLYSDLVYEDVKKGKYDFYVLSTSFIAEFIYLIESYIDYKILDENLLNKIYTMIAYIKENANFVDKETKSYYHEIFNELILELIQSKDTDTSIFFKNEQRKRLNGLEIIVNFGKSSQEVIDFLKESISFDFVFLIYHTEIVDEIEFEKEIDTLMLDEFYFASLNAILDECPEILKDEIFRRRVKKVIELNKKNIKSLRDKSIPDKVYILVNNFKYARNI